ncbi:MAG: hypothetical protein ACP5JH_01800 [Bacteroidota bacterium]
MKTLDVVGVLSAFLIHLPELRRVIMNKKGKLVRKKHRRKEKKLKMKLRQMGLEQQRNQETSPSS